MLGRTRSAARWVRVGLALVAPAALVAPFGACGLDTSGSPAECKQDLDCIQPEQPCRVFRCEELACVSSALPDGTAPTQVPGDCREALCKAGDVEQVVDPDDADDLNDCTTVTCSADGEPNITKKSTGTCSVGQAPGSCEDGVCVVACDENSDCSGQECADGTCVGGECQYKPKHGFVLPNEDPLDCVLEICNQDQKATIPDPSETPNDNNPCTEDVCVDGVPTYTPTPGAKCGAGNALFCNPQGTCVGCFEDVQCGTSTECMTYNCTDQETCENIPTAAGTATTMGQTTGDCKVVVCDGSGNTLPQNDDDDPNTASEVPNDCVTPGCDNGNPVNDFVPADTMCSVPSGKLCNGSGTCVACNDANDCMAMVCNTVACVAGACQYTVVGDGTTDPTGTCVDQGPASCGNTGLCGGGVCAKYAAGTQCAGASCTNAVATPARLCNGSGTCNTVVTSTCEDNFACNGTACGNSCTAPSNGCQPGWFCFGGDCVKKPQGEPCGTTDSDCASGFCTDGFCCNEECGGTCRSCRADQTASANGTCANVDSDTDPANECSNPNPRCCMGGVCGPMGCQ